MIMRYIFNDYNQALKSEFYMNAAIANALSPSLTATINIKIPVIRLSCSGRNI